jgi:DNA-directed RNA polymerase specialized sigma24 family protein
MTTSPVGDDSTTSIAELRRAYLEELDTLQEAQRRVQLALDNSTAALEVAREHVKRDGNVSDFAGLLQPAPLRATLSGALTDFEQSRHRAQRILFRLLHYEGMSMSEIARSWGISRQLVSRFINESD